MELQTGFSPGLLGQCPGCALCAGKLRRSRSKGNFEARHSSSFFPYKGYCASALR